LKRTIVSALLWFTGCASHASAELQQYIEEQKQAFPACLEQKSQDALNAAVSQSRIEKEFSSITFVPSFIELDR